MDKRESAVSCGFLRKSAAACDFLRKAGALKCCHCCDSQEKARIGKNLQKSAKNCDFGCVCPFQLVPFNSPGGLGKAAELASKEMGKKNYIHHKWENYIPLFSPCFPSSACSLSHHFSPLHLPLYPPCFDSWRTVIYHSFRNHYILNSKTIKPCNCNRGKFLTIPRGIISCNCILQEKQTVTVMLINSEDP